MVLIIERMSFSVMAAREFLSHLEVKIVCRRLLEAGEPVVI
jgi:hypothetical protein